ncbi:MAG: dehydrogenase [Sphingomonas bacterium]|uniref:dihydrolipoamide acetyltransferase family protein n=1 Tax=Sphingomonas bacterium TaxID=1895847 RepID=UPI002613C4B1|nr:dihydrolipoamide acetyltransferase family protein [Sphingomonas bacterium]MDB5704235.1 dehydrogenase [Sphingomonas bacterium]
MTEDAPAAIVMPKLGLTMSEGLLAEWLIAPGDEVAAGQILFVVETDKISNEVEAPAPGRIVSLLVGVGDTVDVGTPVAMWTGPGIVGAPSVMPDEATAVSPQGDAVALVATSSSGAQRIRSTPFARRLAKLDGIEIAQIAGTGARGRIQARDVQAAIDARHANPARSTPAMGRDLRPLIAARVSRSKAEIPHFYVTADARFDALNALRGDLNADPQAPRKVSVTAFLAIAVARALALVPEANVVWRGNRAAPLSRIAIGIAVDTPGGVMAPVVPVTGGVHAFADMLDAAIARARQGKIGAADAGEAAIGISNVGMFAVRSLTPIIDPDQSFMLGVGAPQAVFRPGPDGAPQAAQEVTLSLACDHRAIDGAGAARFLATIVDLLEHPGRLLISRQ